MSFFKKIFSSKEKDKLNKGLEKSKESFIGKFSKALVGKSKVDESSLDEIEDILISSDVGVSTTLKIIDLLEERIARDKYINTSELMSILKEEISSLLKDSEFESTEKKPYIILVVGVNGVGKTTTIGKLANKYTSEGKKVFLGAADTFRAAAVDQLKIWGERTGAMVIAKGMGTDPASVAYETVSKAMAEDADVIIIDTAGRLHNKVNLMNELTKIKKVISKVKEDAPHEVMLVIDGSTGQNAFEQAKQFSKATEINSLAVTKLDGSAKGGVLIGISDQFKIPVKYIGVGEGMEDLQIFDKNEFVDSFFG